MAVRQIRTFDDGLLRKRCRPVETIDGRIRALLDDMAETMEKARGCGLAACQVGVLRQMITIDVGEGLIYLVNPVVVSADGEQLISEACLSFPGLVGLVRRPARVTVQALDAYGRPVTVKGTGRLAQCLCHEIDHLDGIVLPDRMIRRLSN